MTTKKGLIYCLLCPKTKQAKYVGQTVRSLSERLNEHKFKHRFDETSISNRKNHYKNWIKQLYLENLINDLEIFLLGEYDVEELNSKEFYWINFFENQGIKLANTLRNENGWGGYLNEESQKKRSRSLSQTLTGKIKPHSDKQKEGISKSLIGNTRRSGIPCTEEAKKNISKGRSGIPAWNKQKVYQYDKDKNFLREWDSIQEASKTLNIWNIDSVLGDGDRKYAGGFIWIREFNNFPVKHLVDYELIYNKNLKKRIKIKSSELGKYLKEGWIKCTKK